MRTQLILVSGLFLAQSLSAATITLSDKEQTRLSLTLHPNNFALVQDSRTLGPLTENDSVIVTDVSKQMHPQSLQISGAGDISEQTLNRETFSYSNLISQHIGKQVTLVRTMTNGDEVRREAKLLNAQNGRAVVSIKGSVESFAINGNYWRLILPKAPENLRLKPSLTFKSNGKTTTDSVKLSYLTNGLYWGMDYVLELNQTRDKLKLKGLASLHNDTSTAFKNADIKLLAGEINAPSKPQLKRVQEAFLSSADNLQAAAPYRSLTNQPDDVSDFKLFTLAQKVSLQPQQQTQIPIIKAEQVSVDISYEYNFHVNQFINGSERTGAPDTKIEIINDSDNQLGIAFPSGSASIYTADNSGSLQFSGESHLSQSSKGETITLTTGKTFDISIKQQQTHYEKAFDGAVVTEQLIISNHSNTDKTLKLSANFNTPWEINSSTYPVSHKTSSQAHWKIKLLANSSNVFNLQSRLKFKPRN